MCCTGLGKLGRGTGSYMNEANPSIIASRGRCSIVRMVILAMR